MQNQDMITDTLARHASSLAYSDIPAATLETAKRLLLDGIGCLLAGTRATPGRLAARTIARFKFGGAGHSTILINGSRGSARDAAFVNGITLYGVGINDIHQPSGSHPGGCIIPVLLAVGEWQGSSGKDMIAAMTAGYDVQGRLGRGVIPSHRERGFHPTGTLGTFGATAAAGRLLNLSSDLMVSAMGLAGSQAAGLKAYQTDGSMTLIYHAGRAAQNGVEAAVLAQDGFVGPRTVIEDPMGFVAATSDRNDLQAITRGLGEQFEVDATSFRPYFGCALTIPGSGATARIMKTEPRHRPEDVVAIKVRCSPLMVEEVSKADPTTLLAARLSLQFNIGLVMMHGDVLIGDIDEDDLNNPAIRRFLPLVEFETDPGIARYHCTVTVRFQDGGEISAEASKLKGGPDNPMGWDDVEHKFLELVKPLGFGEQAACIVQMVRGVEETNGVDLVNAINVLVRHSEVQ